MLSRYSFFNYLSVVYTTCILLGTAILFFISKGDILLQINSHHDKFQDHFFKNFTHLGDGLILIPVLIFALTIRYYYGLILFVSGVLHGFAVLIFKKVLFTDAPRPTSYISDPVILHFVDGVEVHSARSFPSGHTATAFVVAIFLSLIINKKSYSILFLGFAILVGYSRIYLLQHFYIDTLVGALIGTITVLFCWLVMVLWTPDHKILYLNEASLFKGTNRLKGITLISKEHSSRLFKKFFSGRNKF